MADKSITNVEREESIRLVFEVKHKNRSFYSLISLKLLYTGTFNRIKCFPYVADFVFFVNFKKETVFSRCNQIYFAARSAMTLLYFADT